jgi:hypothetical protein
MQAKQGCSSCGGTRSLEPVRSQPNMPTAKTATPYGYNSADRAGLTPVRAQSPMSTKTSNPYDTSGAQGLTPVRSQMGGAGMNTNPYANQGMANPSTKVSAKYGSSSFAGQKFTTTGSAGGMNLSKYVGRGG